MGLRQSLRARERLSFVDLRSAGRRTIVAYGRSFLAYLLPFSGLPDLDLRPFKLSFVLSSGDYKLFLFGYALRCRIIKLCT